MPKFVPAVRDYRDRTVMVVMPHPWKGGFFRVAAALCNALDELTFDGMRLRVILGVPANYECTERYLLNPDVAVEQIGYESVSVEDRRYVDPEVAVRLRGLPLITPSKTLPYDDGAAIGEVDAFILLSALYHPGVFVTRKPYAVYIADMIQRYVPEIYSDASSTYKAPPWEMDRNQRAAIKEARCIFATTEQTMQDALHYGGVDPDRTMVFPLFAMDIAERQSEESASTTPERTKFALKDLISNRKFEVSKGEYFLWVTNAAAHKNHVSAFRALRHYYESLGGELKCLICGPVTEMLIPGKLGGPYHKKVFAELRQWAGYNEHVKVLGYISDQTYLALLRNAKFLWHNVIYDNGTFSIIEAASVGTPVLSSAYPQIRFIDESFSVGSKFFDAHDPVDAASKIRSMELHAERSAPRQVGGINQKLFEQRLQKLVSRLFEDAASNDHDASDGSERPVKKSATAGGAR